MNFAIKKQLAKCPKKENKRRILTNNFKNDIL